MTEKSKVTIIELLRSEEAKEFIAGSLLWVFTGTLTIGLLFLGVFLLTYSSYIVENNEYQRLYTSCIELGIDTESCQSYASEVLD